MHLHVPTLHETGRDSVVCYAVLLQAQKYCPAVQPHEKPTPPAEIPLVGHRLH